VVATYKWTSLTTTSPIFPSQLDQYHSLSLLAIHTPGSLPRTESINNHYKFYMRPHVRWSSLITDAGFRPRTCLSPTRQAQVQIISNPRVTYRACWFPMALSNQVISLDQRLKNTGILHKINHDGQNYITSFCHYRKHGHCRVPIPLPGAYYRAHDTEKHTVNTALPCV
jgi:hypothetical protein